MQIITRKNESCEITKRYVEFYVWTGWLEATKNNTVPELYTSGRCVPHTVCLLLLAGF